jgi:hypothetical protein
VLALASSDDGSVALAGDGSFTYGPPPGFEGSDSFTYWVQDNKGTKVQGSLLRRERARPGMEW